MRGMIMSWYDFGHKEAAMAAYLPDGKKIIDTGFYYQELMAIGGWYFHPVPGSGQRSFYNRNYINPSRDDIERFDLDTRATMFINLSKTRFGKLEIKICRNMFLDDDREDAEITKKWESYFDYISDRVKRSWIVLFPSGQNDDAEIFGKRSDAMEFLALKSRTISDYLRKEWGIQLYAPHTEKPELDISAVIDL